LSKTIGGVVRDPQTETVVEADGERGSVLHLEWFASLMRWDAALTCEAFSDASRVLSPNAVPNRFGETEPATEPFREETFCRLWAAEPLFGFQWNCTPPFFGGRLLVNRTPAPNGFVPCARLGLTVAGSDVVNDTQLRRGIVDAFSTLSQETHAFYGAAYIEVNIGLERGGYSYDSASESVLISRRWWGGLPAVPTWLSWFGQPYRDLVVAALPDRLVTEFADGLLLRVGEEPRSARELDSTFPPLPAKLVWRPADVGRSPLGAPAEIIPDLLGD
jgi:hypothetical protein